MSNTCLPRFKTCLTVLTARRFLKALRRYLSTLDPSASTPPCASSAMASGASDRAAPEAAPKLTLGDRMKQYEAALDFTLPPSSPAILRLDGHGFSRFTAHFSRPFDQRIHDAMVGACSDLLGFFPRATVAYTQSDEITLVFPAGAVGAFGERVQKLVSLAASYCSVRLNAHLVAALAAAPSPPVARGAAEVLGTAHFDGRLFAVPSADEALNCLLWRCRGDAVRNSVSAFARTFFGQREMQGRTSAELVEMVRAREGVVYEEAVPRWAREGCLVKRELYRHEGFNPKTGETEVTTRTRTRVEERGVREFFAEKIELVTDKYWPRGDEG